MKRRTYLTLSAASLVSTSGCVFGRSGGEPVRVEESDSGDNTNDPPQSTDTEPSNTEPTNKETESAETRSIEGEVLSDESDPNANLQDHEWKNTNRTTSPWAVTGVVSQSSGERADIQVSVNFIDDEGVVLSDSYDYLTGITNEQPAEFTVRYSGDDPTNVSSYEIFVEIN